MRSTYDADDGDGNAFDDVYVFCRVVQLLNASEDEYRNLRTCVHPTLLGTESWLEAVSRVFLKILKKLSFAERYPSGAHDLGWKPELLPCRAALSSWRIRCGNHRLALRLANPCSS